MSGISGGELIAPFAFLGTAYDDQLKQAFTTVKDSNIYRKHSLLGALSSGSFTRNAPLAKMLDKYITSCVLAKIPQEPVKVGRLFIGKTNLDADRAVVRDMARSLRVTSRAA